MASIVDIAPSLGHGIVTAQEGASTGYDAIDDRRFWGVGKQEGVLPTPGAWKVTPGPAGLTVTVAADVDGALVRGDAVAHQGLYYVAPAAMPVDLDLDPADPTDPRNDLVVLEVKDTDHDASGLSVARLRVVKGTPSVGAVATDAFGVHGTPALPDSAFCLAVVNVPAGASAPGTIIDRRPWALGLNLSLKDASTDASLAGDATFVTMLTARVEMSGVPALVRVTGRWEAVGTAASRLGTSVRHDGSPVEGCLDEFVMPSTLISGTSNGNPACTLFEGTWTPPGAGSYHVEMVMRSIDPHTLTIFRRWNIPLELSIVEQFGTTTSGNN